MFLVCRDLSVLLLLTHTHWLLGIYTERDGWWGGGAVSQHSDIQFSPARTASIVFFVFFSTHAAMAVTACSESINANHTAHLITELWYFLRAPFQMTDWEFVVMLV